jgi:D-alanine--poly(phosphoribitol) ligase subunit 1
MNPSIAVKKFCTISDSYPDHIAVSYLNGENISYKKLVSMSSSISEQILKHSSLERVLIALPQGSYAYAAMFGVLASGRCYAPINIENPFDRIKLIIESFKPQLVICLSEDRKKYQSIVSDSCLFIDQRIILDNIPDGSDRLMRLEPSVDNNLAYVMFTSGTTGKPKGIPITTGNLDHFLNWSISELNINIHDRVSQHPNIGFDFSITDVYTSLCSGATLVPITGLKYRSMPALAIKEKQLTVWMSVPSVIDLMISAKQLNNDNLSSLRLICFLGEALLPIQLKRLFSILPDLHVINTYGPTETTVSVTQLWLNKQNYKNFSLETVALGQPITGMDWYLDGDGDQGEIIIKGPQVANGYFNDLELTKKQFIVCQDGHRGYKTGDWAKKINGQLYFCNRIDDQIKIKGHRLELGEIDMALRNSGVINSKSIYFEAKIYSFVEKYDFDDIDNLNKKLCKILPDYARPHKIITLDFLPRNVNDKIDVLSLKNILTSNE